MDITSKSITENPTERAMLDYLRQYPCYAPVELALVSTPSESVRARRSFGPDTGYDALVEVSWRNRTARYAVEIKASSQPALVEQAIIRARWTAQASGLRPMVFVPYLSEQALVRLNAEEISGIDCSGNCVILGPDMSIWRSGAPNRFRESRPIRNPYSGDSSIITRCFLLQQRFESLGVLREFAVGRVLAKTPTDQSILRPGTISKVVSVLESEMIVVRDQDGIRLVDVRQLMNRLREQYRLGDARRLIGKTPLTISEIWSRLAGARDAEGARGVSTGIASASRYGALTGVDRLSLYVDDIGAISRCLDLAVGRAFANIELIEARSNLPFFDYRTEDTIVWASPIQTWLELAQGGAREREAAESLEPLLVEGRAGEII